MNHVDISTIGYRTRAPVPAPLWVRALCQQRSRYIQPRRGMPATQERRIARELYDAFPFPTLLSRELGISVHTFRSWLRRAS